MTFYKMKFILVPFGIISFDFIIKIIIKNINSFFENAFSRRPRSRVAGVSGGWVGI